MLAARRFTTTSRTKKVLLLAYMREVTSEFARVLTQRLEAEPDPLMRLRIYIRSHLQMIGPLPREGRHGVCAARCPGRVPRTSTIMRVSWVRSSSAFSTRPWNAADRRAEYPRRGSSDPRDPAGPAPPPRTRDHRESALALVETFILRGLGASGGECVSGHRARSPFGGIEGAPSPLSKTVHARPHGPAPTTVG